VDRAEDYRWSSAAAHCGLTEDPVLAMDLPLLQVIPDWAAWLSVDQSEEELQFIRNRTQTGRACSSDESARELEQKFGKQLLPRKRGRGRPE
jgi:putative transposase